MSSTAASCQLPDSKAVRQWFPSLSDDFALLENAGGSQLPYCVTDAMVEYMRSCYVQVGAVYAASCKATDTVAEAHTFMEEFMGARGTGKVVLGSSSTALIHLIANAYGDALQSGDEIIVAQTNHEANATPWVRQERRGIKIKIWKLDPESLTCRLEDLDNLLTDRTKVVAFPHVSNLLGEVVDVAEVTRRVHAAGARVFVDGVAYAPHAVVDVAKWGVDWYVFSNYKVYGPHMASLFGTHEAIAELEGPNHYFIPRDAIPQKFELGALNHEGCAGIVGLKPYLRFLAGSQVDGRATIESACSVMSELERPMVERLTGYLDSKAGVRILGPGSGPSATGIVSFLSHGMPSQQVPHELARRGIGIRAGHMYAIRTCEALGIDTNDGVVRVSLLHYNTPDEIERLIRAFEEVLP
jgi:cysteine desulfurase family protein (TIGR01976 family)